MKRSDMLKFLRYNIMHVIHLEKSNCLDSDTIDEQSYRILQEIEDLGMLPPQWNNPNPSDRDRLWSNDSDWARLADKDGQKVYALKENSWEPEDET